MPLSKFGVANWPKGRDLPTDEQIKVAKENLAAEANAAYARGYQGDWGFSFELTINTYHPATWWHLFSPGEELPLDHPVNGGLSAADYGV
jgi:hypothetical protein